jgi:hypothetical protein
MNRYVVYVLPPTGQKWADGSPVLWGMNIVAASESAARQIASQSGKPVVSWLT